MMNVGVEFYSVFFTDEENLEQSENIKIIPWPNGCLPRVNETIDESITLDIEPYDKVLSYDVSYVSYRKIEGKIIPVIHINGG